MNDPVIAKNLKYGNELLLSIIDASYDGFWLCNKEGIIIAVNKASEKINGIDARDVLGKDVRYLVKEGYFDKSATIEVLKKRKRVSILQTLKNGKTILVTGTPIFIKGELSYVITNDRDMTELAQLREKLEETRKQSRRYLKKLQDELQNTGLKNKNQFIFRDPKMFKVYQVIQKVSDSSATIFLYGESGVGKNLIARKVHLASPRADGPFIYINCASIPENLFESELFGYAKGAFTDAKKEGKIGMLEMADKGTLFLDEIADMPLRLQAMMLHFFDDGIVRRVGDTVGKSIDARIVVASNQDIYALIKRGKFREDLFFRINIVPVVIPPLRERRDDIPILIAYFLKRYNKQYKKSSFIDSKVVDLLLEYSFPGNVRELSNIIERMVIMAHDPLIGINDVPAKIIKNMIILPKGDPDVCSHISMREVKEKFEKKLLSHAVRLCKTQKELAVLLGISQPTVARKLKLYNIKYSFKN